MYYICYTLYLIKIILEEIQNFKIFIYKILKFFIFHKKKVKIRNFEYFAQFS